VVSNTLHMLSAATLPTKKKLPMINATFVQMDIKVCTILCSKRKHDNVYMQRIFNRKNAGKQ
jgi:hypothetical protein